MQAFGNETTIPVLPCISPDETIAFYKALGFSLTYEMRRPYLYLILKLHGFELHFGHGSKTLDPADETSGGCLVMVDSVAPYHEAFTAAMRGAYGKVLATGRPRLTRFRPGQSRFTVVDPAGNSVLFIQRDEPEELEYGGSARLSGLAKAIDNARIFRDFKTDHVAAARILDTALRRHGSTASKEDRVRALAARAELAIALGEKQRAQVLRAELASIDLTDDERARLAGDLQAAVELERWLMSNGKK